MNSFLQLEEIEKIFDGTKVLDSVSIDVDMGRILTIVGVNGSGKTTLLRILAGLERQSRGIIRIDNNIMDKEKLRRFSTMVFQKTTVFNMSVYDNVAFGLKVRGVKKEVIEEQISHALSTVRLNNFRKRKAKKISGGEQKRVSLARAFILHPQILLLDEPTSNLDPANAIIIENVIQKMRKKGDCIIILATHNLHQAKRLSDIITHIHSGKIMETANPIDFFAHPSNEITKKFINGELQF